MGFFDKLKAGVKSLADRVTGGYGKITCTIKNPGDFRAGQKITLDILIESNGDLKMDNVKLLLRGDETTDLEDEEAFEKFRCRHSEETLRKDCLIAPGFQLPAGETKSYTYEVELPADLKPTFAGRNIRNHYTLQARAAIPWGVDLVDTLDLKIVPLEQPIHQHRFREASPFLTISVDCDTARLGQPWRHSIVLSAQRDLKVVRFSASLVAVETFQALVSELDPVTNKNFDETDGVPPTVAPVDRPAIPREIERRFDRINLAERLGFSLNGTNRDYEASSNAPLPAQVTLPYQGAKGRRTTFIEVDVQTNCGHIKLSEELPVVWGPAPESTQ